MCPSLSIAGIDYTFLSQQLSFIGTATQTVRVTITVDTFLEFNENFFGDLVLVPTSLNVTVNPTTATVTILDDDGKWLWSLELLTIQYADSFLKVLY